MNSRYGIKINGVSLIPAATPIPMPLPLMRSGSARSPTTRASSTRLICPKNSVIATGSSQRPTAAIANAAAALARPAGRPASPRERYATAGSSPIVSTASPTCQVANDAPLPAANRSAANGV